MWVLQAAHKTGTLASDFLAYKKILRFTYNKKKPKIKIRPFTLTQQAKVKR